MLSVKSPSKPSLTDTCTHAYPERLHSQAEPARSGDGESLTTQIRLGPGLVGAAAGQPQVLWAPLETQKQEGPISSFQGEYQHPKAAWLLSFAL